MHKLTYLTEIMNQTHSEEMHVMTNTRAKTVERSHCIVQNRVKCREKRIDQTPTDMASFLCFKKKSHQICIYTDKSIQVLLWNKNGKGKPLENYKLDQSRRRWVCIKAAVQTQ